VRLQVVARGVLGRRQQPQPSGGAALGARLGPADQVALAHDADQPAIIVDHRSTADVAL
jgi:hypothetical protein